MSEATVALFLQLGITLIEKFQALNTLFDTARKEGREPTQDELALLDIQDDKSRDALQKWINAQPTKETK